MHKPWNVFYKPWFCAFWIETPWISSSVRQIKCIKLFLKVKQSFKMLFIPSCDIKALLSYTLGPKRDAKSFKAQKMKGTRCCKTSHFHQMMYLKTILCLWSRRVLSGRGRWKKRLFLLLWSVSLWVKMKINRYKTALVFAFIMRVHECAYWACKDEI